MAAAITSITRIAPLTWKFVWSGTAPYYVVRNGVLIFSAATERTEWLFENDDNEEPPAIEVYDSTQVATALSQIANPPYGLLQWWHASSAAYYLVQKEVTDGAATYWKTVPPLVIDLGVGYYQYDTGVLDDETTTTFRVMAVDEQGGQNPIEFDIPMVRNPDPPSISISYSASTGNATISERA